MEESLHFDQAEQDRAISVRGSSEITHKHHDGQLISSVTPLHCATSIGRGDIAKRGDFRWQRGEIAILVVVIDATRTSHSKVCSIRELAMATKQIAVYRANIAFLLVDYV
jgi:hypothetical protein